MATRPFFDKRRGTWVAKYKPDPTGPWVRVVLCKHPGGWSESRPPRKPPPLAIDRHRHFADIEYNARHGIAAAPPREVGLAATLEAYAADHAVTARPASNRILRREVGNFLAFAAEQGITSLGGVTTAHCRAYQAARLRLVSPATLRKERGFLVGAWGRAVRDRRIAANPWDGAPAPGEVAESPITFWTEDEIGRIAAACGRAWQRDLVRLLAATGLRASTGLALEWAWIDRAAGTLRLPRDRPGVKTGYVHVLSRRATALLDRRRELEPHPLRVFPARDGAGPAAYPTARSAFRRAVAKAGVPAGTLHDLRHSYGRALALAGVPVTVIQAQLGHATLAMCQRYVSADQDSIRAAIDRADGT